MIRANLSAAALSLLLAAPAFAGDAPAPVRGNSALTAPYPQFPGATGSLAVRLLAVHNRERAAVGHAPLAWDPSLAAAAASYGPALASIGRLVHSPRETRPGQRENLAKAWRGTLSPEQMVDLWSQEKLLLRPGMPGPACPQRFGCQLFPASSATGRWEDVAHYTQMVWPTTTRVGCAVFSVDWDYLICRYSPPGNIDGKPVFASAPVPVQLAQAGARSGQ